MFRDRPWLLHLAMAIGVGAVIWFGDVATGRHLAGALNNFAVKLAVWYEERRIPTVLCSPHKAVPYTKLAGVTFNVPECWSAESSALLDREVHRFFDPDARAGIVSISVDRIDGAADLQALQSEFASLASRATARVEDSAGNSVKAGKSESEIRVHSAADSLAERFSGRTEPGPKPGAPAAPAANPFRRVETVGMLGRVGESSEEGSGERFGSRPSAGNGPQRTWSWLLLSDREAVRVVYSVRDEWVGEPVVDTELERVRAVVASVKPAP